MFIFCFALTVLAVALATIAVGAYYLCVLLGVLK